MAVMRMEYSGSRQEKKTPGGCYGSDSKASGVLPGPERHGWVGIDMVLLGASAFLAEIDILAPVAMRQAALFTHRAANRASLQQLGDGVAAIRPPVFHRFVLFAN